MAQGLGVVVVVAELLVFIFGVVLFGLVVVWTYVSDKMEQRIREVNEPKSPHLTAKTFTTIANRAFSNCGE